MFMVLYLYECQISGEVAKNINTTNRLEYLKYVWPHITLVIIILSHIIY